MGTSTDFGGGTGGAWSDFKRAATYFVRGGGGGAGGGPAHVVGRHVAALGGASRATSTASAGIGAAQQIAGLVAGIARDGLDAALREADLGHLVGQDRFHVVEGLLELILRDVGAGSDAEAANQAACDVLEDLFDPDAITYADLAAVEIDRERVAEIVKLFLAAFVFRRLAPILAERFTRIASDASEEARLEDEIRGYISAVVKLEIGERDAVAIAWTGVEGRDAIRRSIAAAYEYIESHDR
jgi:hypothetical protein